MSTPLDPWMPPLCRRCKAASSALLKQPSPSLWGLQCNLPKRTEPCGVSLSDSVSAASGSGGSAEAGALLLPASCVAMTLRLRERGVAGALALSWGSGGQGDTLTGRAAA